MNECFFLALSIEPVMPTSCNEAASPSSVNLFHDNMMKALTYLLMTTAAATATMSAEGPMFATAATSKSTASKWFDLQNYWKSFKELFLKTKSQIFGQT